MSTLTFELSKPIFCQGVEVKALSMDFDSLTVPDIKNARKVRAFLCEESAKDVSAGKLSPRLDENLRIGLAWIAAMKQDNRLTLNDVLQLSAKDALNLAEESLDYLFS